uniref:Protein THEM6 n=1 Tax=Phallusia mammillata TaxID=59560 RepID=A0A6F9DU38_9ASCI|nr:protein THEM6 [Phallusia mammillata]
MASVENLTFAIGSVFAVAWYYALSHFWEGSVYIKCMWILLFLTIVSSGFLLYAFRLNLALLFVLFRKFGRPSNPQSVFDEHTYKSVVLPSDLDVFLHMNNARYGRMADYARFSFLYETGIGPALTSQNYLMAMTASVLRYRRSLQGLQRYTISTKLVYWEDDAFYFEQKFISPFKDIDNFVYCVILCKMSVRGESIPNILKKFLNVDESPPRPVVSAELQHFIDYNRTSSQNLRSEATK